MGGYRSVGREDLSELVGFTGTFTLDLGFPAVNGGGLKAKPGTGMRGDDGPGDSRSGPRPGPAPAVRHQPAPRRRVLLRPARAAVGALSRPAMATAPALGL